MTELSQEARELIVRARPAERADASAKKRVRAALAAHLAPPPAVPPPVSPGAAGALGVSASATKLVLICSLTAAGVVGTAALVKTRHAAEPGSAAQRVARVVPPAAAPLALPDLRRADESAVLPSRTDAREVARPGLGTRERLVGSPATGPSAAPARKVSLRASPVRAAEPAELPVPVASPQATSGIARAPASQAVPEPRPSAADHPSTWRARDFPAPIPDRQVTRVTSPSNQGKACSAGRELKLLSGAQAALREANGQRAIDLLDQHAQSCPSATFWEERSAARALALCLLHREPQALAEAAQLASRAPRSPLLARLRSSCAAAAVTSSTKPAGER